MPNVVPDRKIFTAVYTGTAALTLNTTNAPWLVNVRKIIRPSLNSGINTRQSYNGAYGGATPGGAVTTLTPGMTYEFTWGDNFGQTLPNFALLAADANGVRLVAAFTANATTTVPLPIRRADQVGTFALDADTPVSGLTSVSYQKNGTTTGLPVTVALNDVLSVTATAGGTVGELTLIKQ